MPDSEPEKYSIDEILERLRQKNENSELSEPGIVTRADGSQAVRVKKRKRRSDQPLKKAQAKRRQQLVILAGISLFLIVLVGVGGLAWVLYLNSSKYRDQVIARLEQWSGAEVNFQQLSATPFGVSTPEIRMTWPESSAVKELTVYNGRGDLSFSSHLCGNWSGRQFLANGANRLVFQKPTGPEPWSFESPDGPMPYQFPVRLKNTNVIFGSSEAPAMGVEGTEVTLIIPNPEVPELNFALEGGEAKVPGWGNFRVKFGSLILDEGGLVLNNLQLYPASDSKTKAEIRLAAIKQNRIAFDGEVSEIGVTMRGIGTETLMGQGLESLIKGRFETLDKSNNTARLVLDVTDLDSLQLTAPVRASYISPPSFVGFDFLMTLAQLTSDTRLENPQFEAQGSAKIERTTNLTRVTNLVFTSQGLISLEGSIEAKATGELSGVLEVGLPESRIKSSGLRAATEVFARSASGQLWATVTISGTVQDPQDDLAMQLEQGSVEVSPAAGGIDSLERTFFDLTTPGE